MICGGGGGGGGFGKGEPTDPPKNLSKKIVNGVDKKN